MFRAISGEPAVRLGLLPFAFWGYTGAMGLGDHPMRTPLYGVLMVIAAVLLCWLVASTLAGWQAALGYLAAIAVGAIGFVMTLRDLDNFPNWRR
jgi:hypothetical protein